MSVRVQVGGESDLPAWLDLAREVEPLFGPMVDRPEFLAVLVKHLGRGSAFCVRVEDRPPDAPLLGGLLWSARRGAIGWLAVAGAARRRGVGAALVRHVLGQVPAGSAVWVATFCGDDEVARAAHGFYTALGFLPAEIAPLGAAGEDRRVYRRPAGPSVEPDQGASLPSTP